MGKTALVDSTMLNEAIRFSKPVLMLSLDISIRQIFQRMISNIKDKWKKRGVDFITKADKQTLLADVVKWG